MNLCQKTTEGGNKTTAFEVTEKGKQMTDRYAEVRRQILTEQTKNIDRVEDLSNSEFWLSNKGLHLVYSYDLDEEDITFNGFSTTIKGELDITDNQVTKSKIEGNIRIPVVDKVDGFDFEIPVTNDGLAQGYLIEDLTKRDMVFNPYGGENRVNISINRAVFADLFANDSSSGARSIDLAKSGHNSLFKTIIALRKGRLSPTIIIWSTRLSSAIASSMSAGGTFLPLDNTIISFRRPVI